jgi:N-acetylneuraminic acid mutarotase
MAFSASALNGKIYIFGGLKTIKGEALSHVEEYDPQTRTCTIISDMPIPRACFSTSVVNEKIYVVGGIQKCGAPAYRSVDAYDPTTDEWIENVTAMPTPRYKLTTSVVNGKIYIIGGMSGFNRDNSCIHSTVEVYDPETGVWTTAADMPTARRDLRSEVLDGKIYVFGGRQSGEGLTTTEMYDPETDSWVTRADMIIGRYYHASSVAKEKIYAFGGVIEEQPDISAIGKPIRDHEDYTK